MVKLALLALVVAACQGGSSDSAPKQTEASPKQGSAVAKPAPADAAIDAPDDPDKVLADLHAIPAWDAVVDRAQYLARRGQHGVVYGSLGAPIALPPAPPLAGFGSGAGSGSGSGNGGSGSGSGSAAPATSPTTWLVDDTDGNGALAIRVELGKYALKAKQGDRVALGGAWALDDNRRWFWKVDALQPLPPPPPPKSGETPRGEVPAQPGHALATGDFPAGVKRISMAKEGELAYFQVVGAPPAVDGDGWPVADELGNPVVALLVLPGERASYGAQDMRTPDERWQLKRGQTYWVRIGRFHKRGPDKPPSIIARTAPIWVR